MGDGFDPMTDHALGHVAAMECEVDNELEGLLLHQGYLSVTIHRLQHVLEPVMYRNGFGVGIIVHSEYDKPLEAI